MQSGAENPVTRAGEARGRKQGGRTAMFVAPHGGQHRAHGLGYRLAVVVEHDDPFGLAQLHSQPPLANTVR